VQVAKAKLAYVSLIKKSPLVERKDIGFLL
jgi:hypothetical protein